MKTLNKVVLGVSAVFWLQGCASTPMGPTVQVLPAANKPFEVFQQEQALCKQYAQQQIAGQSDSANEKAVGGTLLGAALGAGLGAAAGGGHGAGVGAAAGGIVGTGVGMSASSHTQHSIQEQYNQAYVQCMYAKGNQVAQPVPQAIVVQPAPTVVYTTPPPVVYTPPPTTVYVQQPPAAAPAVPPPPPTYP